MRAARAYDAANTNSPIMSTRKDHRTTISLPVRIWGMDFDGKLFRQDVRTIDITPVGAKLKGVRCNLHRGAIIGVQCGTSRARSRVVWIGENGEAGQIGIELLERGKYIWGTPLTRVLREEKL
jgi:hypothetical protein